MKKEGFIFEIKTEQASQKRPHCISLLLYFARYPYAYGHLLRASAEEHPELFWGLRGGGGNLGVATAFEVNLNPVGTIMGGAIFYEATEAERILQDYARLAAAAPDGLSTEALLMLAPPVPFIPPDKQGTPIVSILVCYTGDLSEGEQRVREAYAPATYARLVALKNQYDPTNLFHLNQNIKPTL